MFASKDFLQQHVERRHNGETSRRLPEHRREAWQGNLVEPNQKSEGTDDARAQRMLREVELALQSHQENLRSVAQTEAMKIQELYEKLHVENQLAEEIKSSRLQMEEQLQEQRALLEDLAHQKVEASQELNDIKEQIAFCKVQAKMERQGSASVATKDLATDLEIKRLEQALTMANTALAASREELFFLQATHLAALKEKRELSERLEQVQLHAKRLEDSLAQASGLEGAVIPVLRAECTTQTVEAEYVDVIVETEGVHQKEVKEPRKTEDESTQTSMCAQPETSNAEVQTEKQLPHDEETSIHLGSAVVPLQAVSQVENIWHEEEQRECGVSVGTDTSFPELLQAPVFVHELDKQALLEAIKTRAQRFVPELNIKVQISVTHNCSYFVFDRAALDTKAVGDDMNPKQFSSLQRRNFLRSRFLHDESSVKERIGSVLHALDDTTRRYGLSPKSTVLSDEHLHIVQRALHAHLEILPTTVLEKIISCESEVNEMITREWLPREKVRLEALERLQIDAQFKSERNQRLVQQAMATCAPVEADPLKNDPILQDEKDGVTLDAKADPPMVFLPPVFSTIPERTQDDLVVVTDCLHNFIHDKPAAQDAFGGFNPNQPDARTLENVDHEAQRNKTEAEYDRSSQIPKVRSIGVKPQSISTLPLDLPIPELQQNLESAKYSTAVSLFAGIERIDEPDEVNCTQLESTMELETGKHVKEHDVYQERPLLNTVHDTELNKLSESATSAGNGRETMLRKDDRVLLHPFSEHNSSLRSLSIITSSELSYSASIPSLGSEIDHSKDDTNLPNAEMVSLHDSNSELKVIDSDATDCSGDIA